MLVEGSDLTNFNKEFRKSDWKTALQIYFCR